MSVSGSSHDPYGDEGSSVETVRLSTVQELLTAVPFLLGFQPHQCLVVLAADDANDVIAAVGAAVPTVQQAPCTATRFARCLGRDSVATVMLVGYCDHREAPVLTTLAGLLPWPVDAVLLVDGRRWWSLARPGHDQDCPREGRPLIPQDRVRTPLLVMSGVPAASHEDLAATLAAGPREVVDRVRRLLDRVGGHGALSDLLNLRNLRDLYAQVEASRTAQATHPQALTEHDAAVLLLAVDQDLVRDACVSWHDDAAVSLWRALLPMAPPGWVAAVATLLALASYQRGDGVLARLAAERALQDDPDYTFADMIIRALRGGLSPHELRQGLADTVKDNPLLIGRPRP
jgi:hypothetical protein